MAKFDQIKNDKLRGIAEKAFRHMRQGQNAEAVHALVEAYFFLLELKPEILSKTIPFGSFQIPAVWRWPSLGANLKRESVRQGVKPVIEFTREKFASSEAMTYYEYVVDSAIQAKA